MKVVKMVPVRLPPDEHMKGWTKIQVEGRAKGQAKSRAEGRAEDQTKRHLNEVLWLSSNSRCACLISVA
jgi:hypothetical protein